MTVAAIGLAIALVAALLALAIGLRRSRAASAAANERLTSAVAELNLRMDATVRELRQALERAEAEGQRQRRLSALAASLDLDEVLARTLDATRALPGVDAAVVSLDEAGDDGRPLVATLGLSGDEALRQPPISGPPDGREATAIRISYRYGRDAPLDDPPIRSGVAVPLRDDGAVGHLAVFTRSETDMLDDAAVDELAAIAAAAAPAIDNARRFGEARRLADLDALTGLHNRRFFHETLGREVARAQRYRRSLALAVFDVDDFKAVNDRIGHLEGDAALAEAADRIRDVVRTADIPCRVGGDEFGVILPESSGEDAEQLSRRIQRSVAAEAIAGAGRLSLSAGVAELNGHDDARSLFERADSALYRAKAAGRGRIVSANSGGAEDAP